MIKRRRFIKQAGGALLTAGSGLATGIFTDVYKYPINNQAGKAKRIFIARFSHETNTFHPLRTTSFRYRNLNAGLLDAWKNADISVIPGISATPAGGGLIEETACREAMERVYNSLCKAMPVDAVFLRLHGAMFAEGVGHAETELVENIREIVGDKIPIACTFDLHGNIPSRMGQAGDILVGLKTAPHVDQKETAELAGRILSDTLEGKVFPVSYVLPVPIIVQGEKAMTTAEPFGSLVEEAKRIERTGIPGFQERILAATLFVGCAWTDAPATGMSVMITADRSIEAAKSAAGYLAKKIWAARHQFKYGCETAELEEGVSRALRAEESTVFLTDSGDNVTASAPGDLPVVLRHLIERDVRSAVIACINDTASVKRCYEAGKGKKIRLSIGAFIEKRYGPPLAADAEIVRLYPDAGLVIVKINGVEVILSEGPRTFRSPGEFEECGINPLNRKIVVTKMGYLYPELTKIAPRHIMLLTPGAADMRIEKLTYTRLRRPIFPFDPKTRFDIPG